MKVLSSPGLGPIVATRGSALLPRTLLVFRASRGILDNDLPGVKHFGLGPSRASAQSSFGTREWPKDVLVPQGGIEFDVEDIEAAAEELRAKGYRLLHGPRLEPWGQTVARLLSPEGLLVGLSITPWMREGGGH